MTTHTYAATSQAKKGCLESRSAVPGYLIAFTPGHAIGHRSIFGCKVLYFLLFLFLISSGYLGASELKREPHKHVVYAIYI